MPIDAASFRCLLFDVITPLIIDIATDCFSFDAITPRHATIFFFFFRHYATLPLYFSRCFADAVDASPPRRADYAAVFEMPTAARGHALIMPAMP